MRWTVLVLAVVFAFDVVAGRRVARVLRSSVSSPLRCTALVHGASVLLATVRSVDPATSFSSALTSGCLITLFFMEALVRRSPQTGSPLITAALLGTVPMTLYGLVQYLGLDPLSWRTDSVSSVLSTMGRSNFLGAYLAMVVPLTLFEIGASATSSRRRRMWVLLGLQTLGVLMTQARAAWLALVGGAVVFVVVAGRDRRRARVLGVPALVAAGALVYVAVSRVDIGLLDRRPGGSFLEVRDSSIESRMTIWRNTSSLIAERWFGGHGPGTYEQVFDETYPDAFEGTIVGDPHNLVLAILFDAGLLGLATFAVMIGAFFRALARTDSAGAHTIALRAALSGSVVAFLIQAQFNPVSVVPFTLFWLCLAIAGRETPGDGL